MTQIKSMEIEIYTEWTQINHQLNPRRYYQDCTKLMPAHYHHSLGLSSTLKKVTQLPINVLQNELGLHLDISLIVPGIVVCSYPVVATKRQLVRNKLDDLIEYLNTTYGLGNWRLYNLKSEVGDADYSDADLFNKLYQNSNIAITSSSCNRGSASRIEVPKHRKMLSLNPKLVINTLDNLEPIFLRKGWLDHFPPPFDLLQDVVDDMGHFLAKNNNHVCVLHCKMGKGRSGTICVAYLMKFRNISFEDSMEMFTKGRFKRIITQGITIKSQLRYLKYHKYFLSFDSNSQSLLMNGLKANYSCVLSSLIVNSPTNLLLSSHVTCWLSFKRYNSTRTALTTLYKINLTTHVKNETKEGYVITNQDIFDFPISLKTADLMIEFELKSNDNHSNYRSTTRDNLNHANKISRFMKKIKESKIVYTWINVLLESLKYNFGLELPQHPISADDKFKVTFNWNELDTVMMPKKTGLKLFESIELVFEQSSF